MTGHVMRAATWGDLVPAIAVLATCIVVVALCAARGGWKP